MVCLELAATLGRPSEGYSDSRPRHLAICRCHSDVPYGRPRCTLQRNARNSISLSARLTRSSQSLGSFNECEEMENRTKTTRKRKAGGGGRRERVPDEYLAMLGATGEYFLFKQMQAVCPQFDATNWKSRGREFFGFGAGDDSLGYDFEYEEVGGLLTGRADEPRCRIEVKSSAHDGGDSFEMSTNEREVAQETHLGVGNTVYVIIRAANVASKPEITDLLIDPIQLHLDGVLDYSSRDLLFALGWPVEEDD
jgi:hypothetical protein